MRRLIAPGGHFDAWRSPAHRPDASRRPTIAAQVAPIFKKYCAGCHNDEDREGEFSLEIFASLQKGTEHGPAISPGRSQGQPMIRLLTGAAKPACRPRASRARTPTRSR